MTPPTDIIGRIWLELLPPDQRPDSDIVLPNIQKELNKLNGYEARIKGNTYSSSIVGPKDIEIEVTAEDKRLINQAAIIVETNFRIFLELKMPK